MQYFAYIRQIFYISVTKLKSCRKKLISAKQNEFFFLYIYIKKQFERYFPFNEKVTPYLRKQCHNEIS